MRGRSGQHKRYVHLISLGCDKNLVDSEKVLRLMLDDGYQFTDDPALADVIIVNTCCFIHDAKEESVSTLIRMADLKSERAGKSPLLIVMGCMAERYKAEIQETLPEIDILMGANSWQDILEVLHGYENARLQNDSTDPVSDVPFTKEMDDGVLHMQSFRGISENVFLDRPVLKRFVTAGGHFAYLKIAEGCGKRCTYCIIPYLKGNYRSVPMEDLVKEASMLAESGVKELILIAQETTLYGTDLYGRKCLPELLEALNAIEGLRWIRLMYCYPEEITDELIECIRRLPKVCHYLDIPIQHASDHILKRMARRTTHDEITDRIRHLRELIPDIVIRTTLISGFPGETDADHKKLAEFVRQMEFDRLGVFEYSREEGTKAAAFSHQVSAKTKALRRNEIMELQQEIAWKKAQEKIGRELDILIEGRITEDADTAELPEQTLTDEGYVYVGRSYMDAPDIDGFVYIPAGRRELMTGDMVRVRVTGAHEYDLMGEIIPSVLS